jgi:hypothetical protein
MSSTVTATADQVTANLILQLQLEDAGVYLKSHTGKSENPTDAEVAFQLQQ